VDLLDPDADPDPAIFVFDLKMPTKNQFKKKKLFVFIS